MKKVFSIFLCGLLSQNASAKSVLVLANPDLQGAYESFLRHEKNYVTPTAYFLEHHADRHLIENLNATLERAQHEFLNGSLNEGKKAFDALADMALQADWNRAQRESIFYGIFRRAQLSHDKNEQEYWLTQAVLFAWDLAPETKLFPPPLVASWEQIRKATPTTHWRPQVPAHFTKILVNGKLFDRRQVVSLELPLSAKVRVTLLSDSHGLISQIKNVAQLKDWAPTSRPLATGTCEAAQLREDFSTSVSGYFQYDCVYNFNRVKSRTSEAYLPTSYSNSEPTPRPTSFLKNKWLWWGVASVLAASAVYHAQRPTEQPVTSRDNF